jgi:hypothetical protein
VDGWGLTERTDDRVASTLGFGKARSGEDQMRMVASVMLLLGILAQERAVNVVQAPDSPVKLEHATVLSAAEGPPVLLYAATNLTTDSLEQFTVMVFTFTADGTLKARQVAPGRRSLDAKETKYSAMVLDGSPAETGDSFVIGVNQAQRVGSEAWWRADLQTAAEARVRPKP